MEFATPAYGWLAIAGIAAFLISLRAARNWHKDLCRLAEPRFHGRFAPNGPGGQWWARSLLWLFGVLLLVAALARPQWGSVEERESSVGLDIIVALDVSRSMLADDLSPNRLAAAKQRIVQLLDRSAGDRIGLVAFAGSSFLVCPLTTDQAIIRQMLDELGPDSIPKGGSSLAAALAEAQKGFRGTSPGGRLLMVVSDGEDHSGNILPAVEPLRREGVTIIAAQTGTSDGGVIRLPDGSFVKTRSGTVVKSHAVPERLRELTPIVISLDAAGGLETAIAQARAELVESARQQTRRHRIERFQFPLSAALFLFGITLLPGMRGRQ